MDHVEKALELYEERYNCAQSVFCSMCDIHGMDFETATRLAAPFGGGIGGTQSVCGAVMGMVMTIGLDHGFSDPKDKETRAQHNKEIQDALAEFSQRNGSTICEVLLNGAPHRSEICYNCVRSATEIGVKHCSK